GGSYSVSGAYVGTESVRSSVSVFPWVGTMERCDVIRFHSVAPAAFVFVLERASTNVCGNGALEPGEDCDDGNFANDDACPVTCLLATCRNGRLDGGEECDDGNLINGDGCDTNCSRTRCGNGVISPGEQCDDGN